MSDDEILEPMPVELQQEVEEACSRFNEVAHRIVLKFGPELGLGVVSRGAAREVFAILGPEQAAAYFREVAAILESGELPTIH